MIQLTEKRYNELLTAEKKLRALEAGGVDNWEGYHTALSENMGGDEEESEEEIYGKPGEDN